MSLWDETEIDWSKVSGRTRNVCVANDIRTYADLAARSRQQLSRLPNCGKIAVRQLAEEFQRATGTALQWSGRTRLEPVKRLFIVQATGYSESHIACETVQEAVARYLARMPNTILDEGTLTVKKAGLFIDLYAEN